MKTNLCHILTSPTTINTIGLVFDIFGAILLFKFGLPEDISRSGHINLILEQEDVNEKAKGVFYDKCGKIGLFFIILGFFFQLLSNFI